MSIQTLSTKNKNRKTRKIFNKRKSLRKHTIIQKGGKVIKKKIAFKLGDNKTSLSLNFKFGNLNYVLVNLGLLDSIPFTHPEKLENKLIGWHLFYYNDRNYNDFIIDSLKMNTSQDTLRRYPTLRNSSFDFSFKKVKYEADVIKSIHFYSIKNNLSNSYFISNMNDINLSIDKKNKIIIFVESVINNDKITMENNPKFYEFLNNIYHTTPELFGHKSISKKNNNHNNNHNHNLVHNRQFRLNNQEEQEENNNTHPLLK